MTSCKKGMLSLPWWKQSNVSNLPPVAGLPPWGTVSYWKLCWALLLADWALSGTYGHDLVSPCIDSIPATLFKSPLVDGVWGGVGKRRWLVFTKQINLSLWLLKSFSTEVTFWWIFTWNTSLFTFLAHSERSSHIPLLQIPLLPVFQSCCFQVPHHPANLLATTYKLAYNCTSGHFFF